MRELSESDYSAVCIPSSVFRLPSSEQVKIPTPARSHQDVQSPEAPEHVHFELIESC